MWHFSCCETIFTIGWVDCKIFTMFCWDLNTSMFTNLDSVLLQDAGFSGNVFQVCDIWWIAPTCWFFCTLYSGYEQHECPPGIPLALHVPYLYFVCPGPEAFEQHASEHILQTWSVPDLSWRCEQHGANNSINLIKLCSLTEPNILRVYRRKMSGSIT